MYKRTKQYRVLMQRIKKIENNLVKNLFSKNVMDFTERELDLCRGYEVLCHAEIESYFEEIAKKILEESIEIWNNKGKVTLPIVGLFANFEKIDTSDKIDTKINKIILDYSKNVLKKNHGIKEENMKKMFGNLGIVVDEFDATWLATLNSYGAARGVVAHTSVLAQETPINIKEEVETVRHIIDGIEQFEIEIEKQTKINLYKAGRR